jgi:hypothetical protein
MRRSRCRTLLALAPVLVAVLMVLWSSMAAAII